MTMPPFIFEPLKFYLAGRYSRREELLGYAKDLENRGYQVPCRWLAGNHQAEELSADDNNFGSLPHPLAQQFGHEDLEDLVASNVIICFTEEPRLPLGTRGGRHVELGVAIGLRIAAERYEDDLFGPDILVVGPRENVFYSTQFIDGVFPDWESCLAEIDTWGTE